jgi:hypothetical protein
MATSSDAGGVVPRWVQHRMVPREIMKDAEFAGRYLVSKRQEEG